MLVKLGFFVAIMSGIPDSLRCIPLYKVQDFWFHTLKTGFGYMGQNTMCTSMGLQVKVLVVVHPHLSYSRMTFRNPRKSAILTL